jgi:excisionase family DNA binding protein
MPNELEQRALRDRDAARYLDLSESWLRKARMNGSGPPFIKVGRTVRYLREDLDSWLEERRRASTIGRRPVA